MVIDELLQWNLIAVDILKETIVIWLSDYHLINNKISNEVIIRLTHGNRKGEKSYSNPKV